jgi:hypothetical protein
MGRRRIKKDTDKNIYRDQEAFYTEKRLQKVHVNSHPLRWMLVISTGHIGNDPVTALSLLPCGALH